MQFTDGVNIDVSGDALSVIKLSDGYYVKGQGMLIPCASELEGHAIVLALGQPACAFIDNHRGEVIRIEGNRITVVHQFDAEGAPLDMCDFVYREGAFHNANADEEVAVRFCQCVFTGSKPV